MHKRIDTICSRFLTSLIFTAEGRKIITDQNKTLKTVKIKVLTINYEFTIRLISLNNIINVIKIFGFFRINSPLRRSLRHLRILPKNRFCENWN